MKSKKITANEQKLVWRYLLWCYKTTKETLDRIDRYYTQLWVDKFVLEDLKAGSYVKDNDEYRKFVDVFADYKYLRNRFGAIEKAITHFFISRFSIGRLLY